MERRFIPEKIDAERIYLKKLSIDLAEIMFKCIDEDRERLSQFLPWPKLITEVQDELNHIQASLNEWDKCTGFSFALFTKKDDLYIGNIGVHAIMWGWERCEIGYWILGRYEGQGYMREAVSALTQTLHQQGFNRVEIHCDPNNLKSSSIPKSLGYKYEARMAQYVKDADGNFRDMEIYAHFKSNTP